MASDLGKDLGLCPNIESSVEHVAAISEISREVTPASRPFMVIIIVTESLDEDHLPLAQLIPRRVRSRLSKENGKPIVVPDD
ncbi:hypothetical protein HAX54_039299 [Datura stramonium]|uniref:Uncharacterized protein n=1 Tax=Datura stramonium TaxID=4076 RepID=A0ABS8VLR8_DATST|nr:hypothetical protein [Datura stramonium]